MNVNILLLTFLNKKGLVEPNPFFVLIFYIHRRNGKS